MEVIIDKRPTYFIGDACLANKMKTATIKVPGLQELDIHIGNEVLVSKLTEDDKKEHNMRITAKRLLFSLFSSYTRHANQMMRILLSGLDKKKSAHLQGIFLFLEQYRDFCSRTQYSMGDFKGFRLNFMRDSSHLVKTMSMPKASIHDFTNTFFTLAKKTVNDSADMDLKVEYVK